MKKASSRLTRKMFRAMKRVTHTTDDNETGPRRARGFIFIPDSPVGEGDVTIRSILFYSPNIYPL